MDGPPARERRQALPAHRHLRLVHAAAPATPRPRRLSRGDLLPLETYLREREAFRERVLAHQARRRIRLGNEVLLRFEDRLTVLWQLQEALRIERVSGAHAIDEQLEAWNPRLPDGGNLKATMRVEPVDGPGRARRLAALGGIERRVHARVAGFEPVRARTDLSPGEVGVFFLCFDFPPAQRLALQAGAALSFGIHDGRLPVAVTVPGTIRAALLADFASRPRAG